MGDNVENQPRGMRTEADPGWGFTWNSIPMMLVPQLAGFTFVGFVQLAPTVRHFAEDQESLALRGCHRSLIAALRMPPPRPKA